MKNIRDSYKYYKKNSSAPVEINTYLAISMGFIKFLMSLVMSGDEVVLPAKLGVFRVNGKKQKIRFDDAGHVKGLSPNWARTKLLWKSSEEARLKKQLVYNTNEHSDSLRYKFLWSKRRSIVENKNLYTLTMTRANKRELAARIKSGQEFYSV